GSSDGAPIPLADGGFFKDHEGNLVLPRLNETGLKQLAAAGGGSYRRIRIDDEDFQDLLADLDSHRLDQAEQLKKRLGDRWQEAGIWLLWLLLLPATAAFRRGWLTVLILGLLLPAQAEAGNWMELWQRPDQLGKAAFDAGQYESAAGHFQDPKWKAISLYRAGRYDEAIKTLPEDETADDWYNRGNALARCGRLQEALAAYDRALKLNPEDEDIQINHQLVAEALKQQQSQKHPSPRENRPGQQAASADTKENGADRPPGEQNGTDGQQSQQQAAGAQSHRPPADPQPGQVAETPAEQAAAAQNKDAATGQGAQLSSRQQDMSGQTPDAATTAEASPEDAEEQQLRQQLQAIPDDPGGLLRRKFLYQYRRRGQQLETDRPW
ncbi:MAG: tetratricopeptide repeat protein, partial [Desulfuromonadaceae bacterium]